MKLSDLSLRDHIAIEALPAVIQTRAGDPPMKHLSMEEYFARKAFKISDAMITEMGKYDEILLSLQKRAEIAETTLEILRPEWMKPEHKDFIASIALTELWDLLDVHNQTAAIQKLRDLLP